VHVRGFLGSNYGRGTIHQLVAGRVHVILDKDPENWYDFPFTRLTPLSPLDVIVEEIGRNS
jgi:hypothetical protein